MHSRAVTIRRPSQTGLAVVASRTRGYRRRAEDRFYLERATGWRDLLASWAGSFHVFSTLPLSFDLIALGVEVVE
jgi:hypothetical protein